MITNSHDLMFRDVCLNNEYAVNFLREIFYVFRICDNVWDEDESYTKEEISNSMMLLMIGFKHNPFYMKNREAIDAQLFLSLNSWMDANEWKRSNDENKKLCAWHIKEQCRELVVLCAYLIGGFNHARKVSLNIRTVFLKKALKRDKY